MITLIKAVSESGLTAFEYEENGAKIKLKADKTTIVTKEEPVVRATESCTQVSAKAEKNEEGIADGNVVKSPLVGTFYSAPSPEDAPFVQIGDAVKKGQVLGIVEAMKLMNEIESEYDGVVKDILVSDAGVVEYDQPMFVIG